MLAEEAVIVVFERDPCYYAQVVTSNAALTDSRCRQQQERP